MPGRHRGIWVEPGTGPSGEPVFCVIDHAGRRLAIATRPLTIPLERFTDALWAFLEAVDPLPHGAIRPLIPPPLYRLRRPILDRIRQV